MSGFYRNYTMSFRTYLTNLVIDAGLAIYGIIFFFAGIVVMVEYFLIGLFLLITAILSLLYTRYRKQKKGITY